MVLNSVPEKLNTQVLEDEGGELKMGKSVQEFRSDSVFIHQLLEK